MAALWLNELLSILKYRQWNNAAATTRHNSPISTACLRAAIDSQPYQFVTQDCGHPSLDLSAIIFQLCAQFIFLDGSLFHITSLPVELRC